MINEIKPRVPWRYQSISDSRSLGLLSTILQCRSTDYSQRSQSISRRTPLRVSIPVPVTLQYSTYHSAAAKAKADHQTFSHANPSQFGYKTILQHLALKIAVSSHEPCVSTLPKYPGHHCLFEGIFRHLPYGHYSFQRTGPSSSKREALLQGYATRCTT